MAISMYDDAIIKKFRKWFPNEDKLKILKPNEVSRLWQIKANENNDKPLTLPLIAISRDPSVSIDIPGRRNLSCSGVNLDGSEMATLQLNAIPINISYQVDIYTDTYENGDTYLREVIFNIVNHPKMKVLIPYNGTNIKHVAYLWLESDITDNSDIPEKKFPDQFTRWTIKLSVHDAFFFSIPEKTNAHLIGAQLEVKDIQPGDDVIETVVDLTPKENDDEDDED